MNIVEVMMPKLGLNPGEPNAFMVNEDALEKEFSVVYVRFQVSRAVQYAMVAQVFRGELQTG